jgi:hypothetical protein
VTRRAEQDDDPAEGPSTLELQDRALDGPPTLVRDELFDAAPDAADAGADDRAPTIVRTTIVEPTTQPDPATSSDPDLSSQPERAPLLPEDPNPQPSLWASAPRWAKGTFAFGVACLGLAGAVRLWSSTGSRAGELPGAAALPATFAESDASAEGERTLPSPRSADARQPAEEDSPAKPVDAEGSAAGVAVRVGQDPGRDAAIDARTALDALRDGVRSCVEETIGVMPGTSPPVPAKLSRLSEGAYEPSPSDWASPFFMCTRFRLAGPQRFQIQWQLDKPSTEGSGIAWIDDDGDGKADRAFGFHGKLVERSKVELSETGPVPAGRPVR